MGKGDIRISPKHGVNPSLLVCFFCGDEFGVALHGMIGGHDREAPRHTLAGPDSPCERCAELMKSHVLFLKCRVRPQPKSQPERMGLMAAIPDEQVRHILTDDVVDRVLQMRVCYIDEESWGKTWATK